MNCLRTLLLLCVLLCAGGGAVEAGLSIYLENFATSLGSREQLAIAEFADALLVLPKTLAVNAAKVGAGYKLHTAAGLRQHVHWQLH
jgi:T-complex protein 1 subunit alpha